MYQKLLEAPKDHLSHDFIKYIYENNPIVYDGDYWIGIENCKWHKEDSFHYTFFAIRGIRFKYQLTMKEKMEELAVEITHKIKPHYNKYENRSVERLHFHIIQNPKHYFKMQGITPA